MVSTNELSRFNLLFEFLADCASVIDQKTLLRVLERHIKWIIPFDEMVIGFSKETGTIKTLLVDRGQGIVEETISSLASDKINALEQVIQEKTSVVLKEQTNFSTVCSSLCVGKRRLGGLLLYSEPAMYSFQDVRIIGFIAQYLAETISRLEQEETIKAQIADLEKAKQLTLIFAEKEVTRLQLERTLAKEKEAVRYRDEFLSIASHELKTPLTTLKLQLQLADHRIHLSKPLSPLAEQLWVNLRYCLEQSNRLEALVRDMLDASRIQSGRLSSHVEKTELGVLLDNVIAQFSDQLSAVQCNIERIKAEEAYILCDRFRVSQVLTNLLTNVMKYAPGKPVRITIEKDTENARLTIQDHGPGLAPDQLERIFWRFERASPSKNIGGMGLGLYISREIMSTQHGSLTVKSKVGEGSSFIMTFPLLTRPSCAKGA